MDELLSRQVPQSVEAEQSVLGAILRDSNCAADVIGVLSPEDFYLRQNREVYETIYDMAAQSDRIDPVLVAEAMQRSGRYDQGSTRAYLAQLMDVTPTTANVMEYVRIVKDKALLRRIGETAGGIGQMVADGTDTANAVLEAAEKRIMGLRQIRAEDELIPISSVVLDVYDRIDELESLGGALPGLETGFSELDQKLSGLNKSDLILLAARPAVGKTSFALNILMHVAKKYGRPVVFFSLEMSREQLGIRLLSSQSLVNSKNLVTGRLSVDEWDKIRRAGDTLAQTKIYVDDNPSISVAEMSAKCRRVDNLGLIVIDYLQLMQSAGAKKASENRQQAVSEISRTLKIMAKELNVPVLCLSQLSRAGEARAQMAKDDKRARKPILSDLRESGSIEQDADSVLFLYKEDAEQEPHKVTCIVAKNRHGETGELDLFWHAGTTTFRTPAPEWRSEE